jgi:RimJ/RimL family protein N-acetyltransferase
MIELEPFERHDFDRLIGWVESEEMLMQWAGPIFRWPLTREQLEAYLRASEVPDPPRLIFRAVERATGHTGGRVVGHVELGAIDRRNGSATLSRVLVDPGLRGAGIGQAMVHRVLEIGFEEMGLHRVDLYVFDFNRSAIGCYERLGFAREGILRDYRRLGERYLTTWIMAMLEDEWRARQEHPR